MIGLNKLQIVLVSIIILLTSGIIQEYQEELMQKMNDNLPLLISGQFSTPSDDTNNSNGAEAEKTISTLIQSYKTILQHEYEAASTKNTRLAFGYVADLDVYVDGVELMQKLGFEHFATPRFHDRLSSIEQISETFAMFFEKGAGTELFVEDQSVFDAVTQVALSIAKKQSLGGNASTMAVRAFKEGAQVVLGHAMSDEFYEQIFNRSATLVGDISEGIRDIHLVLDFYKDTPWAGKTTPRSNRMYLNHDTENSRLAYMDKLHGYLREQSKENQVEIVALGGFQLLNHRNESEVNELMQQLGQEILDSRMRGIKTHFEMGTFTDHNLFQEIAKNALINVDSIGLNEQELTNLIEYLSRNGMIEAASSEMDVNSAIQDVLKLISLAHNYQFKLSRVHFHTINMQMICGHTSEWGSSRYAIVKAIMVALQESENEGSDYFAFDPTKLKINMPDQIILPTFDIGFTFKSDMSNEQTVQFDAAQPVTCWNPHKSINCCVAPVIQVVHPQKTCGLGDNISSTGLIYHKIVAS